MNVKWANPKLGIVKNGLYTIHFTLPSCQNFQKIEFSIAHETQKFSRFGGLSQHLCVSPLCF